jgi:hypothetical protein
MSGRDPDLVTVWRCACASWGKGLTRGAMLMGSLQLTASRSMITVLRAAVRI